jgi:hypothetical protein
MKESKIYKIVSVKQGASDLVMYADDSSVHRLARSLREEGATVTVTPSTVEEMNGTSGDDASEG